MQCQVEGAPVYGHHQFAPQRQVRVTCIIRPHVYVGPSIAIRAYLQHRQVERTEHIAYLLKTGEPTGVCPEENIMLCSLDHKRRPQGLVPVGDATAREMPGRGGGYRKVCAYSCLFRPVQLGNSAIVNAPAFNDAAHTQRAHYLYQMWVKVGSNHLNKYLISGEIPQLPVHYEDEAGVLLNDIQATITKLDLLLGEKSDMIDLLSHDLRSPVGRIMNLSGLIKTDDDSNKELYADYITNECKSLLRILENILLMLKDDNHSFRMTNVNLKNIIDETVGFFDFALAEKSLSVGMAIDESVHVIVQPELFTQAIRNIIGNAIKFSSDGQTIYISARQDKEQVSLIIQDEGLGFLPADMRKIFNRFTSAGKSGTRGETSVGLGLYLSKKIIERHGGKLTAYSDGINKGATFTIELYRLITTKKQGRHKMPAVRPATAAPSGRVRIINRR